MNKVNPIQSREVCCCGARSWALVIGWIQTIFFAYGTILFGMAFFTGIQKALNEDVGDGAKFAIGMTAFLLICTVLSFAQGIILIVGAQQGNGGKLQFWCVAQIIQLVWCALALVASLVAWNFKAFALNVVVVAISVFFLWVVNVYRKEIISNVPYSREV